MFKNVLKKEIIVPAKMSYLKTVRDFIEQIGHQHNYSEKIVNSFKLVIDESCTNIIRHGYLDVSDGKITIRAIVRKYSLTIVVIDQGVTFDPRQAKNPDLKKYIDIGKKGGLGILMMRKLMDDIQYSLTPEGNELRLTKKRDEMPSNNIAVLWDSLSMQARFTSLVSVVIVLLGIGALFFYSFNTENALREDLYYESALRSEGYAANAADPLQNETTLSDINLYQLSRSILENEPDVVNDAFLVDPDSFFIANSLISLSDSSNNRSVAKINKFDFGRNAVIIDTVRMTTIYKYPVDSVMIYDFVSPVLSRSNDTLAFAHVWLEETYIEDHVVGGRNRGIIIVSIIVILSIIMAMFLINRIINPFSQLAEWVRHVGQGKMDQDEFDIDTSDELGEIAQAFSDMTIKFREAQVSLIEQQRLQKELQVAQEIQHMLLPQDFPQVKGYELASYYEAAKEVGGDLFDFVDVDEDTLGICVADVSGKGVPGSMIMTMIRTALRLEAKGNKSASDVLARVNRFVTSDMKKGMFVTVFYIILDSRNRVVSFASAGHNPMILFRASTEQTYYLNPQGFPVGISLPDIKLFDEKIETDRINLRSDDILVIYTDGVTEAMNSRRELFADERFLEVIRANGHLPVQDFVRNCRDAIRNFTSGFQQNDDITLVAVKEKLSAADVRIDVQKKLFHLVDVEKYSIKDACEKLKVSPFTYYKYRPIVDKQGIDGLIQRLRKKDDIELRHLSIEVKAKIFDIIKDNPEFEAVDLAAHLDSEKYGFTKVSPEVVQEELRRLKLDTVDKRKRFVKKGSERKFLKTPGTPLLTLDGKVIKDFQGTDTFSPIYQPKKRVFTNLDNLDDPSGQDEEAAAIPEDETLVEADAETKAPESDTDELDIKHANDAPESSAEETVAEQAEEDQTLATEKPAIAAETAFAPTAVEEDTTVDNQPALTDAAIEEDQPIEQLPVAEEIVAVEESAPVTHGETVEVPAEKPPVKENTGENDFILKPPAEEKIADIEASIEPDKEARPQLNLPVVAEKPEVPAFDTQVETAPIDNESRVKKPQDSLASDGPISDEDDGIPQEKAPEVITGKDSVAVAAVEEAPKAPVNEKQDADSVISDLPKAQEELYFEETDELDISEMQIGPVAEKPVDEIAESADYSGLAKRKNRRKKKANLRKKDISSKIVYVEFFEQQETQFKKLFELVNGNGLNTEIYLELENLLAYFLTASAEDRNLNKLFQLFVQFKSIANHLQMLEETADIHAEALEKLHELNMDNVLAEDMKKIRLINSLGVTLKKLDNETIKDSAAKKDITLKRSKKKRGVSARKASIT
jgi:serine phosphatase RsbU (regulator of sigma subunit)/anti-sigma regulatory factor (Ser/Thr protein kinase)/transposase